MISAWAKPCCSAATHSIAARSKPWGEIAQTAFGKKPPVEDRGPISQAIFAVGRQDIDPDGLMPPHGIEIMGASSDHLIADSGRDLLPVGTEITFQLGYGALVHAMTSPFVARVMTTRSGKSLIPG